MTFPSARVGDHWISNFFSLLLPGGIGRDISRDVYLARFRIGALEIARSILTDRFIGLVSIVVLSLPCMIFALHPAALSCDGLGASCCFVLDCRWASGSATGSTDRYYAHKTAAGEIASSGWCMRRRNSRDFRPPRLFGIPFLQSCAMMAATILCVMAISGAIGGFSAPL